MNLLLDLDFDPDQPWPYHYDPDYDFLFGKVGPGLPQTVWEGHTIFNSLDTVPAQIKPRLMQHYNDEVERVYQEQVEAVERLNSMTSPKSCKSSSKGVQNQQ